MTGTTASRLLRTSLRLALTAFATGLLLGMTATLASAASGSGDSAPAAFAAEHVAPQHDSPPAPTTTGALTACPEGADCGDEPVDPQPQHDADVDLTACPKWQKCDPPPKDPGGFTTCPVGEDCDPEPTGPGGFTTCPEHQDCSPSEEPTDEPTEDPSDDPADPAGHDVPVPTRIDTGMGGAAPVAWSWSLLGDVLLAVGSAGAYAGVRL